MHIEIAPSRAKLLSSRGTTLELYCLASTDIRLSSAREPSRAITLRQSPARRSRVSRERLASFVTFLVSGTVHSEYCKYFFCVSGFIEKATFTQESALQEWLH